VSSERGQVTVAIVDQSAEYETEAAVLGPDIGVRPLVCANEEQLPADLGDVAALMVRSGVRIAAATLNRLSACRAVIRAGVGYDNVDGVAAGRLGMPLVNVPDYGTNEVADHTLALLLASWRRLGAYHDALCADPVAGWRFDGAGAIPRLTGATLGVVGLGRIGTAVALRARAFGMHVAFYDPYVADGYDKAYQLERIPSLADLVRQSDCLTLHCPLTEETEHLVDAALLAAARPGLTLVNAGRGRLVSLDAVHEALRSGRLRAFAADVLESEPPDPHHPLLAAVTRREPWVDGRVLLTPHAAFYSVEALHEARTKGAEQLLRAVRGQPLRNCVNLAALRTPRTPVLGWPPTNQRAT
jgi:phosphoglycerate dehydrogenase-like enzyme